MEARNPGLLTGAGVSSISSVGSLSPSAIFATANGCSSLNVSGNGTVDSFNSSSGPYSSSHLTSGGNVGTNGNVTLSGNPVVFMGPRPRRFAGTGNLQHQDNDRDIAPAGEPRPSGGQGSTPSRL